jgi:hypothetical protein
VLLDLSAYRASATAMCCGQVQHGLGTDQDVFSVLGLRQVLTVHTVLSFGGRIEENVRTFFTSSSWVRVKTGAEGAWYDAQEPGTHAVLAGPSVRLLAMGQGTRTSWQMVFDARNLVVVIWGETPAIVEAMGDTLPVYRCVWGSVTPRSGHGSTTPCMNPWE